MSKSNHPALLPQLVLGLLLLLTLPAAGIALYWLATFPDVERLAKNNPSSTALMEARATEARRQGRRLKPHLIWIPLSRISPHLQRAVIVAEDASFYIHDGFDWEGIREALVRDIELGELRRGGSTITQQLAKNLYLSSDKTVLRKINEALIARSLERRLSKKRILELYLNVVEWGQGVYGAEAAARHHFGKPARDLTAEEAALLAAILPAPRLSDPLRFTPYVSKRQQQILRWMNKSNGPAGASNAG